MSEGACETRLVFPMYIDFCQLVTCVYFQWPLELSNPAKGAASHFSSLPTLHGSEAVGTEVRGVDFVLLCFARKRSALTIVVRRLH